MDSFCTPEDLQEASQARLLVAISFHYLPNRTGYLTQVLRTLAGFPVAGLEIVVFTNTSDPKEHTDLERIFHSAGLGIDRVRFEVAKQLEHPFHLTWAHKPLITDAFLTQPDRYTHFVYLEDDEELTFNAFSYFLAARKVLRKFGLLPGLVRVEWDSEQNQCNAADNTSAIDVASRPFLSNGTYAFIEPQNTYFGSFILDQELAHEYVASRSFSLEQSRKVTNWHVRERAAMGLTFENPPLPFVYRCAVPILISSREVPRFAWLGHLHHRFAANPNKRFIRLPMTKVFVGSFPEKIQPSDSYELYSADKWFVHRHRLVENSKRRSKIFLKHFFPNYPHLG